MHFPFVAIVLFKIIEDWFVYQEIFDLKVFILSKENCLYH